MRFICRFILLSFAINYVFCGRDKGEVQLVQRISSFVGLGILVFVVIYICGCITFVLYCAWRGKCREMTGEDGTESVCDVRPPNYNEIFKGREQKFSLDSSELPTYEAVEENFSFAVNSRSSRRASRISVSSNQRRGSVVTV